MSWILLLVLFGNLWIWRVFTISPLVCLLLVMSTLLAFLSYTDRGKIKIFFLVSLITVVFLQYRNTDNRSLYYLTNEEREIQRLRIGEYPKSMTRLGYWIEGRNESVAFFKAMRNFGDVLNPSYYFFSNHPVERVGVKEYEKFPYILSPFFVYGTILFVKKRQIPLCVLLFGIPIILTTYIGNYSTMGNISLFPAICLTSSLGFSSFFKKMNSLAKTVLLVAYLLVIVQLVSYATV